MVKSYGPNKFVTQIMRSWDNKTIGLWDHGTIGFWEHGTYGPWGHGTLGPRDFWPMVWVFGTSGQMHFVTMGLSDILSALHTNETIPIQPYQIQIKPTKSIKTQQT